MNDAYFEQSVDMRKAERHTVFTENGSGVSIHSPSLDPTTSASALRLRCFVSTSKMIMQRVKQGILKGILEFKARESQLRQTSDVQALIDLETQRREELMKDINQKRRQQRKMLE